MEEKNPHKKIMDYLKKNVPKGYNLESLQWALINQGHSKIAVLRAIEEFKQKPVEKKTPIVKERPAIKYEVYDENDKPILIKSSFWRTIFKMFK